MRKNSWTEEEKTLLSKIFVNNTKPTIQKKFPNRSWASIRLNAQNLGLKRNPAIIKKERIEGGNNAPTREDFWTEEDDNLLKDIYLSQSKEEIQPHFPKRTWQSIRGRAVRLGLKRRGGRKKNDPQLTALWKLPETQEKLKQSRLKSLGVEYATQNPEVKEKIKKVVQTKYGVDNVFQSEEIKEKIKETNLKKYGVESPQQNTGIHQQTTETIIEKYGVDNMFKRVDLVQAGMLKKYGVKSPLQHPEIQKKQIQTNMIEYGFPTPSQDKKVRKKLSLTLRSKEVRIKKFLTLKKKKNFKQSDEEVAFYAHLKQVDPEALQHRLHPLLLHTIDFYLPTFDMWVQYDGVYWHGKITSDPETERYEQIEGIKKRDKLENEVIPNLIRFWSDETLKAIKEGNIVDIIKNKLEEKIKDPNFRPACHQYKKKIEWFEEDINQLPFNPDLSASQFDLQTEKIDTEIKEFIQKYEWLGTIGLPPKWCFTARYQGVLGGVVLINEPSQYSKLMGKDTPIYEALIQRGASSSWAPINLGSRLVMFACRWMVNNTTKRVFTGYADPAAYERGTIYRACNFDYLGKTFGSSYIYNHPDIQKNNFTQQYLSKTATLKKWCLNNNITTEKTWFKENGYKNLEAIPMEIKEKLNQWKSKILSEAEKIPLEKKSKYALILGTDKREQKILDNMKTYIPSQYTETGAQPSLKPLIKHVPGKTMSRKSTAKIQFIIENYGKLSRPELAKSLNETPRWIKRQIYNLSKSGKIQIK